jgi:hypothetical protein
MLDAATRRGLTPIWLPYQAQRTDYGPYPMVATGQAPLEEFIRLHREAEMDVSPCSDNRPFVLDLSLSTLPVFRYLAAGALALALVLAALGWSAGRAGQSQTELHVWADSLSASTSSRAIPTARVRFQPQDAAFLLYFLALGVGFMLVEIPLAQLLILPLGYPTLALTTILFSLLLGGGLGSWFSQGREPGGVAQWAAACCLGVAIAAVAMPLLAALLERLMLLMSLPARCLLVSLVLLPLGFLLGTPFPAGMRLLASWRPQQVPLIWGLNGVASVVGSLCAAIAAKAWGFSNVLTCGAAFYAGAAFLLLGLLARGDGALPTATDQPASVGPSDGSSE